LILIPYSRSNGDFERFAASLVALNGDVGARPHEPQPEFLDWAGSDAEQPRAQAATVMKEVEKVASSASR
jgi:hypothetical protein